MDDLKKFKDLKKGGKRYCYVLKNKKRKGLTHDFEQK